MRADVLQAVALCAHAQDYLTGDQENPPEFLAQSTFILAHEIKFERGANGKLSGGLVADAPGPWLRRLKRENVERIALLLDHCPFDVHHPTDEPWGVVTDGDVGVQIWHPTWKRRWRYQSDASPWVVLYTSSRMGRLQDRETTSFEQSILQFSTSLSESGNRHPLIAAIRSQKEGLFPDIYPANWPKHLRQLGEIAARVVTLLRSDQWLEEARSSRHITPGDYQSISHRLWSDSLSALEASVRLTDLAGIHPTGQKILRSG